MKINLSNYESFFLDYHEGNLNAGMVAELFLFLEQHPELKETFESFEMIALDADVSEEIFAEKDSLKKINTPNANTINEWLVAELEDDLNLIQRTTLSKFIAEHSQFDRDRKLFKLTKIVADKNIRYEGKEKLYKKTAGRVISMRVWYAAAASLILLLGAWLAFRLSVDDHATQTAGNRKNIPVVHHNEIPSEKINSSDSNHLADKNQKKNSVKEQNENIIETNIAEHNSTTVNSEKDLIHPDKSEKINSLKKINQPLQNPSENSTANNTPVNSVKENSLSNNSPVDLMEPKLTAGITEEEPFVFAERRYIPETNMLPAEKKALTVATLQDKVLNNIKDFTAESVNKVAGEEILSTSDKTPKLPLKSRILRLTASAINKFSGNRVKVKTAFNPINGTLSAYELETGKNIYQKQF